MTEEIFSELQKISQIISKTIDTEKIYLFGSFAYGSPHRDSDYDICVIIPDDGPRPADAMVEIRRALYPQQRKPLDVLVYRESRFRQRENAPGMERKIAREGVVLYERQGAVRQMV